MINKEKIATMAKLARYEKKFGKNDEAINNYFRYDYISRKNLVNIVLVAIFATICVLIYQVGNIYNEELVFDFENLKLVLINSAWLIAIITIIYSFIGFVVYNKEFDDRNNRLKIYYKYIESLDKY